jgi:hypothetical protein
MASSLIKRAATYMANQKNRAMRAARENTHNTALVVGALSGTGTAVAAAFADQKMGAGAQWKVGPVPVVGLAGAAIAAPAFFLGKYPIAQAAAAVAGGTAINLALYRYLVEEGIEAGTP